MKIRLDFADNGIIKRTDKNWLEVIQDDNIRKYAQSEPICKAVGKDLMEEIDRILEQQNEAFNGVCLDIKIKLVK